MKITLNPKKYAQRAIGLIWVLVAVALLVCGIWVIVWIWRLAQKPSRPPLDADRIGEKQPNKNAPTNYYKVEDDI